MTLSLEIVQHLADQLPPPEQARLIEHLSRRLAVAVPQVAPTELPATPDAWARFFAVSDDIRATYPDANPAARLEADRQEHAATMQGASEATDVHA